MTSLKPSLAYRHFLSSMNLNYDEWHDGIGYDLVALRRIQDSERADAVKMLAERLETAPDWRDMQALRTIDTPAARQSIRRALNGGYIDVQMRTAKMLAELGEPADLEAVIIEALRTADLSSNPSQAIDMAERYPSPRILETLLDLAMNGHRDRRIEHAALAVCIELRPPAPRPNGTQVTVTY